MELGCKQVPHQVCLGIIKLVELEMREGLYNPLRVMVNLLCWNIWGLNGPSKQKEVKLLCKETRVGLMGLLETKVKAHRVEQVVKNMFVGCMLLIYLPIIMEGF